MKSKDRNKKTKPQVQQQKSTVAASKDNQKKWISFALVVIAFTTLAIYFKAIKFDFIFNWDDQVYIIDNPDIKILSLQNVKRFFAGFYNSNYHPVTMLVYAIEYKLGNGSAKVFHIFNIVIHLLNTFLVFKLINNLSKKNTTVALITAALFAIHPMHVESVVWISELKDVLYTFFFLISILFYTNFLKTKKLKNLSFTAIFFLLSCFSKSAAVILPFVLLLLDYYTDRKFSVKTILEKTPFFAISLVFGFVAVHSQGSAIKEMAPDMSLIEHAALVSFSFCSYILKAILPLNLSALYPYPIELESALPVIYYISILFVVAILVFVWLSQKWGKDILFGFVFFVITILLVIQLVPVGAASMADRYTYVPYIGLFFIIAKLFDFLQNKYYAQKKMLFGILVICFISYSILSYSRVNVWKNDNTLFSDVINKYPNSSIAYLNRGTYFFNSLTPQTTNEADKNRYMKSAIIDFENALKYPLSNANKGRAYLGLGKISASLNEPEKAVEYLTKSIEIDPTYKAIAQLERGTIYLNHFAGKMFLNDTANRNLYLHKSTIDFEASLKFASNDETRRIIYYNLGIAQSQLGSLKEAINSMDFAIKYNPRDLNGYYNRCDYKILLGDFTGAISDCNLVIDLDPQNVKAYFDRAYIKYKMGNFKDAINDYDKAIEINPQYIDAINNREIIKSLLENYKK